MWSHVIGDPRDPALLGEVDPSTAFVNDVKLATLRAFGVDPALVGQFRAKFLGHRPPEAIEAAIGLAVQPYQRLCGEDGVAGFNPLATSSFWALMRTGGAGASAAAPAESAVSARPPLTLADPEAASLAEVHRGAAEVPAAAALAAAALAAAAAPAASSVADLGALLQGGDRGMLAQTITPSHVAMSAEVVTGAGAVVNTHHTASGLLLTPPPVRTLLSREGAELGAEAGAGADECAGSGGASSSQRGKGRAGFKHTSAKRSRVVAASSDDDDDDDDDDDGACGGGGRRRPRGSSAAGGASSSPTAVTSSRLLRSSKFRAPWVQGMSRYVGVFYQRESPKGAYAACWRVELRSKDPSALRLRRDFKSLAEAEGYVEAELQKRRLLPEMLHRTGWSLKAERGSSGAGAGTRVGARGGAGVGVGGSAVKGTSAGVEVGAEGGVGMGVVANAGAEGAVLRRPRHPRNAHQAQTSESRDGGASAVAAEQTAVLAQLSPELRELASKLQLHGKSVCSWRRGINSRYAIVYGCDELSSRYDSPSVIYVPGFCETAQYTSLAAAEHAVEAACDALGMPRFVLHRRGWSEDAQTRLDADAARRFRSRAQREEAVAASAAAAVVVEKEGEGGGEGGEGGDGAEVGGDMSDDAVGDGGVDDFSEGEAQIAPGE